MEIETVAGTNTNALNEMLKRVHDREKCVIPNLFRNLDFGNDNELICVSIGRQEKGIDPRALQKSIERVVEHENYESQTLRVQEDARIKVE